jgi:hypothetical protein
MTKTAPFLLSLFTMSVICSSVVAYAGQTTSGTPTAGNQTQTEAQKQAQPATPAQSAQPAPTTSTTPTTPTDAALPVSMDRIRKALTAPEPAGPPIRKDVAEDEVPRFVVQTEAPRTLTLRSYLDDGTAVPAYVRPLYDPYHTEFLEMTTPDAYKGCGQFAGDQGACSQVMSSRIGSGLIWQQLVSRGVDNVLRGMFR